MEDQDYILNPFTGEREKPRFSKAWYKEKGDAFTSLVLDHVQAISEDNWRSYRLAASNSERRDWIPVVPDYRQEEITAMSREYVVHHGCVWTGVGKTDISLPFRERVQIGELDGLAVWHYPQSGAYSWLEPESDELVTVTLSYPVELYL